MLCLEPQDGFTFFHFSFIFFPQIAHFRNMKKQIITIHKLSQQLMESKPKPKKIINK